MDDLISRQAAVDAVSGACFELRGVFERCEEALKALPSVQPEKKGKWVFKTLGGWHCSECDAQAPFWCMASTQHLGAYCCECGAEMEEQDG